MLSEKSEYNTAHDSMRETNYRFPAIVARELDSKKITLHAKHKPIKFRSAVKVNPPE